MRWQRMQIFLKWTLLNRTIKSKWKIKVKIVRNKFIKWRTKEDTIFKLGEWTHYKIFIFRNLALKTTGQIPSHRLCHTTQLLFKIQIFKQFPQRKFFKMRSFKKYNLTFSRHLRGINLTVKISKERHFQMLLECNQPLWLTAKKNKFPKSFNRKQNLMLLKYI